MKVKITYGIAILSFGILYSEFGLSAFAQTPQGINYQAVARDASGTPMVSQTLTSVRFVIHKTAAAGTVMYDVTHSSVATNPFGLFNLVIGVGGTVNSGSYAAIPWGSDIFFLEVLVNGTTMGTTQFLTVPYSLYAAKADSVKFGWKTLGNAGTVDGTNFIGTTDNAPLNFRANGQKAGRVEVNAATGNTFLGYVAGNMNTGTNNAGFGYLALTANTSGFGNTANGAMALYTNTSGARNSAFGWNALVSNAAGTDNTAVGMWSLYANTAGSNTAIGSQSLRNSISGNNNVALGTNAGYTLASGSGNVFLGYQAGYSETGSNKLYIANNSTAPLIYGDFGTGRVSIGNVSPAGRLDVSVTSGNTDALNVSNSGSGRAGVFWLSSATNDSAALISYTKGHREAIFGISQGTGHAGVFAVDNSGSIGCAVIGSTNGGGKAIFGMQKGTGYGGAFLINNTANDSAAVIGFTNGTALSQAIYGVNQGLGNAGVFQISNASNSNDALFATTNGTGKAADFTITNASSTSPALQVAVSNSAAPSAIFLGGNVGVGTASPSSTLHVNGSVSAAVRSTTSSTTLTDSDYFIIINGAGTVTLPAANTCPGRIYIIKNLSPSTQWNISPAIIDTNGNPDLTINAGAIVPLISDGTDWQGW